MRHPNIKSQGFTLLEILIALFVFSILSLLLVAGLHSVISSATGSERSSERLHELQISLLILSHDLSQTVERPIMVSSGRKEEALLGEERVLTFTHGGNADQFASGFKSNLQRVSYYWQNQILYRATWPVLDAAPETKANIQPFITHVTQVQFTFLDDKGKWQRNWPSKESMTNAHLPRAVAMVLTLADWGQLKQVYVIPAENNEQKPKP